MLGVLQAVWLAGSPFLSVQLRRELGQLVLHLRRPSVDSCSYYIVVIAWDLEKWIQAAAVGTWVVVGVGVLRNESVLLASWGQHQGVPVLMGAKSGRDQKRS